jgi:hypothetical protein
VLVTVCPAAKVFAFPLFTSLGINACLHNGFIFFCHETNFLSYCAFLMHLCIYASAARYFVLFGTLL